MRHLDSLLLKLSGSGFSFILYLYLPMIKVVGLAELRAQLAEQDRTIRMLVQSRGHVSSSSDIEMNERTALLNQGQKQAKASSGGNELVSMSVSVSFPLCVFNLVLSLNLRARHRARYTILFRSL
jgi:hypothetical protein